VGWEYLARAKAWALWKATYEPRNLRDKTSNYALKNKSIIKELLNRREEIL
jgi:hypothetical protein